MHASPRLKKFTQLSKHLHKNSLPNKPFITSRPLRSSLHRISFPTKRFPQFSSKPNRLPRPHSLKFDPSNVKPTPHPTQPSNLSSPSDTKLPSLNKIIASTGLVSRRNATQLIIDGKILINNLPMNSPTYKLTPTDVVSVLGPNNVAKIIHSPEKSVLNERERVIVLHKPAGYACSKPHLNARSSRHSSGESSTTASPSTPSVTIFDILPRELRTFLYVGRLDLHSSGLLLLTNKGDLVNHITHPSYEIEKEYLVTTRQEISLSHYERLLQGIYDETNEELLQAKRITTIPSALFQPSIPQLYQEQLYDPHTYSFVLNKGYKREIRRMVAIEKPNQVIALHRIRVGNICLGDLPTGKYRELTQDEIHGLYAPFDEALLTSLNKDHFLSSQHRSRSTFPPPSVDLRDIPQRHPNNYLPTFATDLQFSPFSAASRMPPLIDPFEKQSRSKS